MSVDQRIEKVNTILNQYDENIGLSALHKDEDVEKILGMSYKELSSMSDEECGEGAFSMFQYAAFLQKENNRHSAILSWAKHYIDVEVGNRADQYAGGKYCSFEEKRTKALADQTNEYLTKLTRVMMQAKVYYEETNFIANRVSQIGSCLLELQQTKRKNKYAIST